MASVNDEPNKGQANQQQQLDPNYIDQLIKEGEPNWLTNQYVDRPCCVLTTGIILLFIISGASFALGYYDLNPQNNREYLVWTDSMVVDWDKQNAAKEALLKAQGDTQLPVRIQNTPWWNPVILFMGPTQKENLLQKEYLLQVKDFIDQIENMPDWPLFCKAKSTTDSACSP